MLKELLTFSLLILSSEQCNDAPNYKGVNGRIVTSELDCAMQCKAKHNCNSYLYKDHQEFVSGANKYSSNCILQTIWDWNFLADEIIESSNYNSKICIVLPGHDQLFKEKYIPIPTGLESPESKAKSLGFDKKVEFPEQNLVKFYKVLDAPSIAGFWQASRTCAEQKGLLPTPYDATMAKLIHDELQLELDAAGMLIGLTKKDELGPDMVALSRPTYIYDNGKVAFGSLQVQAGDTCSDYIPGVIDQLPLIAKRPQLAFNFQAQQFGAYDTVMDRGITKIVCEFQGSHDLMDDAVNAEASKPFGSFTVDQLLDDNWALDAENQATGYRSAVVKSLVVITFPVEYAIQRVVIQAKPNEAALVQNPRVLISSDTKPNMTSNDLGDASKYYQCGHYPFANGNGDGVFSIVCEKCMPIGKYLTIENGQNNPLALAEISVFGMPAKSLFEN